MLQLALTFAVILLPLLLVLFLRTNAAILFFVLCGASTLQAYLDKDVSTFASSFVPGKNVEVITLGIFILPFVVAALAFRHSVSKGQLPLHLILGLLVGASLVFIGPQFLPSGVMSTIRSSQPFQVLQPYSGLVIATGFLMSTVFLWLSHPRGGEHKSKKRGH